MWKQYNANPMKRQTGDCTVRAISKVLNCDWEKAYSGIAIQGLMVFDMPDRNHVWGGFLRSQGFHRNIIPDTCPDCYTVQDFCRDHPKGTYLLALSGHVVAVKDGDYYDSWDSGNEIPIYYWEREEDNVR